VVEENDDVEPRPFVDVEFEDSKPKSSEIASVEQALDETQLPTLCQ